MGTRYLLDTNIVIDFSAQKLPATAYDLLTTIMIRTHKFLLSIKLNY